MPFGDRTGPYGEGPMTGRGLGYCAGYDSPGALAAGGRGLGRGFGRGAAGRGGGRGYRHWYHATGLTGWQRAAGWGAGAAWGVGQYGPGYDPALVPLTREQQIAALRAQAEAAEKTAERLRATLADMEGEESTD